MKKISILIIPLAPALAITSLPANAQEAPITTQRPVYQTQRHNEDWSFLREQDQNPSDMHDFWDPIKHISLSDDDNIYMSLGGQLQTRLEHWEDFAFGSPPNDDETFLLGRLLLHSDIHFGENVRFFVEGKTALSTDRDLPGGRRTLDVDSLALEQVFLDITIPFDDDASLTLRPGRQQFLFGKQRLVSPLPWANTQRRWDGASAILNTRGWTIQGFWSQFSPVQKYDFNDPDSQTQFYGMYATTKFENLNNLGLDLYVFGLDRDDIVSFNGTTGREERYTIGGRVFGNIADTGFDFDLEAAYQFGSVGAGDVRAFMVGSEVGYRFADTAWSPRFSIGFDYASGDNAPGGDVETFNQLFPLGHAYLGYMDFIGRQNIIDLNAGVSFKPMKKMTVAVKGHLFWRADDNDALYNAGGGVIRAGAFGSSSEVGQEIDLTFNYQFNRHIKGLLGYSHFFPGDFLDESGSADDMDFVYLQLQYTF